MERAKFKNGRQVELVVVEQAYKILGVKKGADKKEIKKKYRLLMHKVHPDTFASKKPSYQYSAQEINEAYSFLCKEGRLENTYYGNKYDKEEQESNNRYRKYKDSSDNNNHRQYKDYRNSKGSESEYKYRWNAPENVNAYTNRSIYHYAEGYDGDITGSFKIASGKYIWKLEEDFALFIKSIFECSEKLLNDVDTKLDRNLSFETKISVQAELAYLLAQQFIDAPEMLNKLLTPIDTEDAYVFYIASMLEISQPAPFLRAGMTLYPAEIKKHRLFLKTKSGQQAGYISFKDDRLYYIVIPLLEQRRAQVKTEISKKQDRFNTKQAVKYKNLDFWIKVPHNSATTFPENINMQIDALLEGYAKNNR